MIDYQYKVAQMVVLKNLCQRTEMNDLNISFFQLRQIWEKFSKIIKFIGLIVLRNF